MLGVGETIVVVAAIIFGSVVAIAYFGSMFFSNLFGKGKKATEAELEKMRGVIHSQHDVIHQLQERVENLEAIVAGSEYDASRRVNHALEEARITPEIQFPQRQTQTERRL